MTKDTARLVMVGILLLSAFLVWYDLEAHEVLGRDENATVIKLDQPNLAAVLRATGLTFAGQASNMQPLYFLVHHLFWPLVGGSPFMLRFLPSAFAILAVAVTFKLGTALLGRPAALVGALLTALLPLYVRYAQIARPYTLLAFLSLASAYFLVRGLAIQRSRFWIGFVLTASLAFYTHYNALFVLLAEGLFAAVVWLTMLVRVRRGRQSARSLAGPVLAVGLVALFCLPGLLRLLGLSWVGPLTGAEGEGQYTIQLTRSFFGGFLVRVGLTTPWLQGLILGLMGLGWVVTLSRRRWWAALFSVLWMAIPFLFLSVMKSPRPFEERYVIFVPPVAMLLVGQGVIAVGLLPRALRREWDSQRIRWAIVAAVSAVLVLSFVSPLRAHYAASSSADRLEYTLAAVERLARPGDVVIISPRVLVRPLEADGAEVINLQEHLSPAELDELAARHPRMWLLYTTYLPAPEFQEPLDRWVQAHLEGFSLVPIKAPSVVAYGNLSLTDAEADLKDRIAVVEALVQGPAGQYGEWVRYGILADLYQALGDLYASQGEDTLAAESWDKAEVIRAAAPPPW